MTIDEAIIRIKEHMTVHKMHEPQAIFITEALDMAIEALEKSKWKSVENDLPKDDYPILVKLFDVSENEFFCYGIANYIKINGEGHWLDHHYGWIGWKFTNETEGGTQDFIVKEWKEI